MKEKIFSVEKPWGDFRQFTLNEVSTVKLLHVNAGEEFSLQLHKNREEFWRVIEGNPIVTVGSETAEAKPGDEFFVGKNVEHRVNGGQSGTTILEIAFGDFDEEDIVRLKDKYGRV